MDRRNFYQLSNFNEHILLSEETIIAEIRKINENIFSA